VSTEFFKSHVLNKTSAGTYLHRTRGIPLILAAICEVTHYLIALANRHALPNNNNKT